MKCPVCEYPQAKLRYQLKDRFFATTSEEFSLFDCKSCGLLFQDEEEIKDRLDEYYPGGYWWQRAGKLSGAEQRYREYMVRKDHLKFLKEQFPARQGIRLLDIGCGDGTLVKLALEAGFDAYGLERSQRAVEIAQRQVPDRVFCGSEEDLARQEEKFDVLVLFHALEHVVDPFHYLKRLQKLVVKPGSLIVQVPNRRSLQAQMLGSKWYGLDCPRHVYNYSLYSVLYLLGRCGYRIQRIRHFSLRDNAAALLSSLLPSLDPASQRVRLFRNTGKLHSTSLAFKEGAYFTLLMMLQPLAWVEARLGRGATVTVHTTLE